MTKNNKDQILKEKATENAREIEQTANRFVSLLFSSGLDKGLENISQQKSKFKKIDKQIDACRKLIRQINDLEQNISEQRHLLQQYQHETTDIRRDCRNQYEAVGRVAFQAFRQNELIEDNMYQLFKPLEDKHQKINSYEVDLDGNKNRDGDNNGEKSGFFATFLNGSKRLLNKSRQSIVLRNMKGDYFRAGEQLIEEEKLPDDLPEIMRPVMDTVRELLEKKQTVENQISAGQSQLENDKEKLQQICENNIPAKKTELINYELENHQQSRSLLSSEVAEIVLAGKKKPATWQGEDEEAVKEINDAVDRYHRLLEQRKLILKKQEIEQLNGQITALEEEMSEFSRKIGKNQQQIDLLAAEIDSYQAGYNARESDKKEKSVRKTRLEKETTGAEDIGRQAGE